jgi:hypothetical protein
MLQPPPPHGVNLTGLIDMHIHTAPDVRPRLLDDVDVARQAAEAGMRAIVLKSHVTCTADRASIAQKVVPGVRVLGSVTLNAAVGGLNPAAVEAALGLGARIVWMPTISAQNHIVKRGGTSPGISLLTQDGELQPALFDVFDLVRQHDAILATGHVSVEEIVALVRAAVSAGVHKVVITHPEVPWVDMPASTQKELRDLGAYFERCYVSSLLVGGNVPLARIVSDIRQVGVTSTVMTTDFGAATLPAPVEGMRIYISALLAEGFSELDVRLMAGETPATLLGLD